MIHIEDGFYSEVAKPFLNSNPLTSWIDDAIDYLTTDVSVDRSTNTLKIARRDYSSGFWNSSQDITYFNLSGWSGRYGKPFELLLSLHLATMAPDFVYQIAYNSDLDTKVNIGLLETTFTGSIQVKTTDGLSYSIDQIKEDEIYSEDTIAELEALEEEAQSIKTQTPYIKTVEKHWFRNVYFDTEGETKTYAVKKDDEEDEDESESDDSDEDDEEESDEYVYEIVDGEKTLKTTTGSVNVYSTSDTTESFTYSGTVTGLNNGETVVFTGSIASNITQVEDGVRGETNATTKELFNGEYYIYDGTTETAEAIRNGEVEKQQINFNSESLTAFSILEEETSIDSQLIYRDLKELLVELDYYDYSDFETDAVEILEWTIPEYQYYFWPYTYLEKQVLEYGTLIYSESSVEAIKEEYGIDKITETTVLSEYIPTSVDLESTSEEESSSATVSAATTSSTVSNSTANTSTSVTGTKAVTAEFSDETQAIVEAHINDFNVDNFESKMESYGGYESYLTNELGGVFAKWAGVDNIANVTTEEGLQEISEYVFGLMTIYGFDYCNGDPSHYGIWRANDGGTSDGFYKGRTSGRTGTLARPRNIDKICAGETTGGTNMTVNCNWGVDYVYYKAGIFSSSDSSKPSSSCDYKSLVNKYGAEIITDISELKVGDIIEFFGNSISDYSNPSSWSGWKHVAFVGEKDEEAGTITLYEAGHYFTNSGNFKHVIQISKGITDYTAWVGLRVMELESTSELTGFEPGLDVIAMGDSTVVELLNLVDYGAGVKLELTGETSLKGYTLIIAGFDVDVNVGDELLATDVIGTTTENNIVLILIDLEDAYVENIEDWVKVPEKKGSSLQGDTTEERLWLALIDAGFSEVAAAGVLGNIWGESGCDPTAVEGGSGEGIGLAQWSYGRKDQLKAYAASKGVDWTDEETQIEFLLGELGVSGYAEGYCSYQFQGYESYYTTWTTTTDIEESTNAFMKGFERPGVERIQVRIDAAKRYYEKYAS